MATLTEKRAFREYRRRPPKRPPVPFPSLITHHRVNPSSIMSDRAGQVLAYGVPPGVDKLYRAITMHGI